VTILDTNVVSEVMASSPSVVALGWISNRRATDDLFTTTITVAEVLYGIELLAPGKRRDKLSGEAEAMFSQDFAGRILQFDEQAARSFAQIASCRRKAGRPITEFAAQIAAIASVHGAALATRNTGDFEGCGIRLINPWVD
jgi:predicted nucleic acid-binding protein